MGKVEAMRKIDSCSTDVRTSKKFRLERWLFLAGGLILLGLWSIVLIDVFLRRFFHLVEKLQELLAILCLRKSVAHGFEIGIEETAESDGEFLEVGDDETLAIDEDPQCGANTHDHDKVADAAVGNVVAALWPCGFFFVCDFFHSVFDVLSPQVLVFERGYFESFHDGQAFVLGHFLSILNQMLDVDVLAILEDRRQERDGDGGAEGTGTSGKEGGGTCGDVDGKKDVGQTFVEEGFQVGEVSLQAWSFVTERQQEVGKGKGDERGAGNSVGHGGVGLAALGVKQRRFDDIATVGIGFDEGVEDELVGDFGVLFDGGVEDLVGSVVGKEIGQGLPWLIVGR